MPKKPTIEWLAAADRWSEAVDQQIAALSHWHEMLGDKGEELAEFDYHEAIRRQEEARKKLEKASA